MAPPASIVVPSKPLTASGHIVMMQIILICNEAFDMYTDAPPAREHLALLAGSIAHVFDYLATGSPRAALRAQLLLDRLDVAGPGSPAIAGIEPLRRAVGLPAGGLRP
jgi:hypothetical protein